MGVVVEVDDGAELFGIAEFPGRGGVGRKHDFLPGKPHALCQHQFGEARTVHPAALFAQNAQDDGVRRGLHRKIFFKPAVPRKGFFQCPCSIADARFVIYVKRRGAFGDDFFQLFPVHEWLFHGRLLVILGFFHDRAPHALCQMPRGLPARVLWRQKVALHAQMVYDGGVFYLLPLCSPVGGERPVCSDTSCR